MDERSGTAPAESDRDRHLRTDQAEANLRSRSLRGGVAAAGAQTTQFLVGLVSTAILARLLLPSDFGLIAMAATLSNLLRPFSDAGLPAATVQRPYLTHSQVTSLFWINTGLGAATAVAMIGLAPALAWFYAEPRLVEPTAVLAIAFVLSGASVQHGAIIRRQMRLSSLAAINVVAALVGALVGIASAVLGAGYWALVYSPLAQQAVVTAGAWLVSGWRPGVPARLAGIRPMLEFGAGLTGFKALTYLANNADNVIIGRAVGAAALGLYSKAYALLLLPVQRVRGPATDVVIPALSRLQHDPDRFRNYYLKAITLVAALGMPVVAYLFVFAEDAILIVLGPQWRESIVLFQALAPAAFLGTFNVVGSWSCMPFGNTGKLFRWQIFASSAILLSFLVGARWGTLGVAVALSASSVALRVPGVIYLLKGTPVRPVELYTTLARPAFASLAAGAALLVLRAALDLEIGPGPRLAGGFALFAALYATLWLAVPGGRTALGEFRPLLEDILPAR